MPISNLINESITVGSAAIRAHAADQQRNMHLGLAVINDDDHQTDSSDSSDSDHA